MSAVTSLRTEVTELLQALVRVDTVNPPGNETRAAEVLRDYLARQGIESDLVGRTPERMNLVARLRGGDGASLGLMSHTDTVQADRDEWTRDPWSGDVVDGELWGRGALDMKGQVAAEAVAFASLVREGFTPAGDLVFVATADEEVGDGFGLEWLVETHPDLVRVDYAIGEGGGDRILLGDGIYYFCGVAEKVCAPFRLRVHGRSGHASAPQIADNALVKAAPLIAAIGALQPRQELIPEVRRFFEVVLGRVPAAEDAVSVARTELGPAAAEFVAPLLAPTFAPTMIEAAQAFNVVPGVCDVTVDCRLLPGQGAAEIESMLRGALGEERWELQWIGETGGTRSQPDGPLWSALDEWVGKVDPGARLLPSCNPGFTDNHYLRHAFGTTAYGFFPLRTMEAELAARLEHSADERAAVDDLELGVEALRHVALTLL